MRSIHKKAFQQGKRRDMTKLEIGELSSVDRPAQGEARATIMKRKHEIEDEEEVKKIGWITVVTSAEDGHQHMLEMWPGDDTSGSTSEAVGNGEGAEDHRHAWFIDDEGQIQLAMNAGHLHAVERDVVVNSVVAMVTKGELDEEALANVQKNFPEIVATEETNVDETEVQKQLDRLNGIVALPATHRAHFDSIEKADEQDVFLAKSATERDSVLAEIDKSAKAELEKNSEVVYTATDGKVFTKSDSPIVVAAIIEADALRKRVGDLEKRDSDRELAKRAETELGNLPGTVETRTALLKGIESIEDPDQRAEALKSVKAANAASATNTTTLGTELDKSEMDGTAYEKLDELAKVEQSANGGTYEQAFTKVADTPDGRELFSKHRESMNSVIN